MSIVNKCLTRHALRDILYVYFCVRQNLWDWVNYARKGIKMTVYGMIDETDRYKICYADMAIYTLDAVTGRWTMQQVLRHMDVASYERLKRGVPGSLDLDESLRADSGDDTLPRCSDEACLGEAERFSTGKR